jgi:predicted N-acetyltransferase YhbS
LPVEKRWNFPSSLPSALLRLSSVNDRPFRTMRLHLERDVNRNRHRSKPSSRFRCHRHMPTVTYQLEPDLTPEDFIDVLMRSTLAERRPFHDLDTIQAMLKNADAILTARFDSLVVGVSRAITDFAYCTYLSDLAVDEKYQRQGIGRELIRRTHEVAGMKTTLILLAAPKAQAYYPHVGMTKHESCWVIARKANGE